MSISSGRKRFPSLKELCFAKILGCDPANISFVGVPPHLIREILDSVTSVNELRRIQDQERNKNLPGFNEALDERWHQFVLTKYRRTECPPKYTWRMFFDMLEKKRHQIADDQKKKTQIFEDFNRNKKKEIKFISQSQVKIKPHAVAQRPSSVPSSTPRKSNSISDSFFKNLKKMH